MKKFFLILISALMLSSCFSGSNHDNAICQLDSMFSSVFPEGEPGAAVLFLKDDSILFDKGYGLADMDTKAAIDGNTFFNIASVSKQFTAAAVLQLAERGELSLEDSVAKYHPEFSNDLWNKVKIKHLLSHSSGVPDERNYPREQKILGTDSLSMAYLPGLDHLNFEPGTEYEYINPTFVLLGDIVSRVSGMPFTSYMRENVFNPAGMEHTLYFDPAIEHQIPNMAHGYEYADVTDMPEEHTSVRDSSDSLVKDWYEYDYGEETFFATKPDGGIYTSTHEFVKWEKALRSNIIISENSRILAHTPCTLVSGSKFSSYQNRPNTWYGMGWFIEPARRSSSEVIYHTGDNGGFKILAARYPQSNALLLIFANRTDWDRYELMQQAEAILGL